MPDKSKTLIVNAGDVRDLVRHMRQDIPFTLRLMDGTEIELVAGDPQSDTIGREHSDVDEIEISL
ncbi:hypothetical protein [Streptomyces sp. H27-C3]|uniref:hypothetical protein n=1 Tax=Streptomyces sp. H27-C3 TaxID=3046305 RepID=UPI0024BAACF1|nr:hypothetical protein [Streptomyces sp. H27-C3]MDJ0463080.1 hypothetical protein [Streptomyces sp. H27-C3]